MQEQPHKPPSVQQDSKTSRITGIVLGIVLVGILGAVGYSIYAYIRTQNEQETAKESQKGPTAPIIGVYDVKKKLDANDDFRLIDVRAADDFNESHIIGSENIPINEFRDGAYKSLPINQMLILTCYGEGCPYSTEAAQILLENGYTNVYDMSAGISGWITAGLSVIETNSVDNGINQFKFTAMTASELENLLQQPENVSQVFLLDTRDTASYKADHIENSINIPLNKIESRRSEIPVEKRAIIIASTNEDAQVAGATLFDLNVLSIFYLADGMTAWNALQSPTQQ